jgi:hypothetical protein
MDKMNIGIISTTNLAQVTIQEITNQQLTNSHQHASNYNTPGNSTTLRQSRKLANGCEYIGLVNMVNGREVYTDNDATINYSGNQQYRGEVVNGKKHGYGSYTFPDGTKYQGMWVNDKTHEYGSYQLANGSKYEGEWRNDKREGHGCLTYPSGNKYEGGWVNDMQEGPGVLIFTDGATYAGIWNLGQANNDISRKIIADSLCNNITLQNAINYLKTFGHQNFPEQLWVEYNKFYQMLLQYSFSIEQTSLAPENGVYEIELLAYPLASGTKCIETKQGHVLPINEYFVEHMASCIHSKLRGSFLIHNPRLNPYTRESITEESLKNPLISLK